MILSSGPIEEGRTWDIELPGSLFTKEEIQLICSIALCDSVV